MQAAAQTVDEPAEEPAEETAIEPERPAVAPARLRDRAASGGGWIPPLGLAVAVVVLWELLSRAGIVSSFLLPTPASVLRSFWSALGDGTLWRYGRTTLLESLAGFALGSAVAVPLGYLTAQSRLMARALEPYTAASQAMPAVAIAPLLVLWLGYGLLPVAVLCGLIVFFPATVNTTLGVRAIDPEVLAAARVDGAGHWALLKSIQLPLALPSILAGLRTSLTLSITGAVVGEFVVGDRGLGGLLSIARGNFNTPLVFATLLTLALMASVYYGAARLIELWAARRF